MIIAVLESEKSSIDIISNGDDVPPLERLRNFSNEFGNKNRCFNDGGLPKGWPMPSFNPIVCLLPYAGRVVNFDTIFVIAGVFWQLSGICHVEKYVSH